MIKINKKPNILVIGDLMIDEYLWGSCERISPEAPVQIVDIKKETRVLGGAGNVISNLVALGSNVAVMSVLGNDEVGIEVKSMLDEQGVKTFLVEQVGRKTSRKTRLMASHSQVVRYDKESKNSISPTSVKALFEKFQEKINSYDIVLLSDYNKGVLTRELLEKVISYANKYNKKVLVDPKGDDFSKYKGAYLLTPNKKEAQVASKIEIDNDTHLKKALEKLKEDSNLGVSLITLSENGIAILENDEVTVKPTVAREVYDVTGAGDTVLASLGFALSLDYNIFDSVEFANLAAGVVVGKIGSATATLDEIEEYKASLHKSSIELHIKTKEDIEKISKRLKEQGKKVVFTNGCFDILHKGHVSYLNIAKSFGDVLILGLNSDASVKRLKGENRPINTQDDRAYILSALECIDYVVIFDEDTPYELIKTVEPDILVKGADYEGKEVVGSDIAKQTKLVEFVDGKSTTKTIEKIKKAEK
ncbi:bifunctional heptose 7-phosphate kinase/heptose 1-phosphate adenyltransferase [Halarcobacter mediterraneus]|uniref:Bifunctional protein HldE n=1 Tax=Halarcobacter mediterraneus TaxID=2023153 RepID=A0A4V1M159_9BACT|nr:D-glycero-beta-D-manno-heptose-7-phosphate kinase [Halarcobacter mediterraneus]RXK12306.1 bifunctional heptose 7-phosphate kinase/heptose 1-phosphate adenyltransferase [Halarcobacter mediterraneus]